MADQRHSRAAVVPAPNRPIEIWDLPVPDLEPGALLVRITASTLCGTDVHRWRGHLEAGPGPFITGHEPCGVVEEISGARTDIMGEPVGLGERVVWSYVSCGHCYWCSVALQPCLCPRRMSWGHNSVERQPALLGSCAQYMYVPPSSQVVHVPDDVSSASAAAAACAYRTVMHGFDRLGAVKSHETVLIQGSGPIGIFATAVARDHGAKMVLVAGAPQARLTMALRMGADAVIDIDEVSETTHRLQWVRDHTGGRGADVVIQAATTAALPEGLRMLRAGGRYVSIGAGGSAHLSVDELPHEMTLYTVRSGEPRHWLQALDFLATRRGTYPLEDIISRTYPLEQINDAMEAMAGYQLIKAVIDPWS